MKRKMHWLMAGCLVIVLGTFCGCGEDSTGSSGGTSQQGGDEVNPGGGNGGGENGGNGGGENGGGENGGESGGETGGGETGGESGGGDKPVKCDAPDADGDTISDEYEGAAENIDTDGDTVPDYKDDDSDGDTIPDKIEGMTNQCSGAEPKDSDMDGIPDFRDTDSDGNGIADKDEAGDNPNDPVDTDGDTVPDYIDEDNDGDTIADMFEITGQGFSNDDAQNGTFSGDCNGDGKNDKLGSPESPIDCDGDTIPDYMDEDSDGDTIPDKIEGQYHVAKHYARYSQDADGDGLSDKEEAGPDPVHPRDTDGDMFPDFIDTDSDGDGLSDEWEAKNKDKGFNPYNADSDGDGTHDLIELGAGTDPGNPNDNPQLSGDFVFIVPYKGETTPKKQTLSFETSIQTTDIYFAIDRSASMKGEIKTLETELPAMLNSLKCKDFNKKCESNSDCSGLTYNGKPVNSICSENKSCIISPSVGTDGKGCFADMYSGVGWWSDLGRFHNASSLSEDVSKTVEALKNYKIQNGSKENNIQAPICAVYGDQKNADGSSKYGCESDKCPECPSCYDGSEKRFGCVGYRPGAVKMLLVAGDEPNAEMKGKAGEFTVEKADKWGAMLKKDYIHYIGLWGWRAVGKQTIYDYGVKQMACYSGSCQTGVCAKDCDNMTPKEEEQLYTISIQDESIKDKTLDILRTFSQTTDLDITSDVEDIDKDASKLIAALRVNTSGKKIHNRICTKVKNIKKDKYESIPSLRAGTSVCYDVIPVESQSLFPPTSEPQMFKARINIKGDGSIVNSGIAYFLVPPENIQIN